MLQQQCLPLLQEGRRQRCSALGCTEGDVGRRSDQSEGVADTLNLPEEGEQHHVVELDQNHNGWSVSYSVSTSQRTR